MTGQDLLRLDDTELLKAWKHLSSRFARPWTSPVGAGDRAACCLLETWRVEFRRFREHIDTAAREDEDISDEDDRLYRTLPRRWEEVFALMVRESGIRVIHGRDDAPAVAPEDIYADSPLGPDDPRPQTASRNPWETDPLYRPIVLRDGLHPEGPD